MAPRRILALLSSPPHSTSSIHALHKFCATSVQVDVLCYSASQKRVRRSYEGRYYFEVFSSCPRTIWAGRLGIDLWLDPIRFLIRNSPVSGVEPWLTASLALYYRSRAISIPPTAVICHGLPSLITGVLLKNHFPILIFYDPTLEMDSIKTPLRYWEKKLHECLSQHLLKHVDTDLSERNGLDSHHAGRLILGQMNR
jgi:hypothetical protein